MGTDLARVDYVQRVTDACDKHFCVKLIVLENRHYLPDDCHAFLPRVVQPANEGADISGACLGRQNCLVCRKYQSDVCLDPCLS